MGTLGSKIFSFSVNLELFSTYSHLDFPGGPVVKSLPANAGDVGSVPGLGSFHVPQDDYTQVPRLLSPCTLEPMPRSKRSPRDEKPIAPTRE